VAAREQAELTRREEEYRDDRPPIEAADHTIILVDDGLATGWTMRAAVAALRQEAPRAIVVAVPVAARETALTMDALVDDLVVLAMPDPFYAVGLWYDDFGQTTDAEVHDLLQRAAARVPGR
jgi:putative phosphoribosyl transferase